MMNRALPWLALLASITLISLTAVRYLQAQQAEHSVHAALISISEQIARLQELESQKSSAILDGEPAPGLSGQITDSLATAGLPPTTLATFHSDADQLIDSQTRIHRRSARITLSNITLAQFGRFISTWRSRRPEWLPTTLTLSPHTLDTKEAARQYQVIQAPLTIQLTIECRFLPKPSAKPATLLP